MVIGALFSSMRKEHSTLSTHSNKFVVMTAPDGVTLIWLSINLKRAVVLPHLRQHGGQVGIAGCVI